MKNIQQLQDLLIQADTMNMNNGYPLGEMSSVLSDLIDSLNQVGDDVTED